MRPSSTTKLAFILPVLAVAVAGCDPLRDEDVVPDGDTERIAPHDTDTDTAPPTDQDGDGFDEDADCDDGDAAVHPDADEVCDERDNDCDGLIDGQDPDLLDGTTWFQDADMDGYGDEGVSDYRCSQPAGYIIDGSDCDDGDASVNPSAREIAADGVDSDCDGVDSQQVQISLSLLSNTEPSRCDIRYNGSVLAPAGDIDGDGVGDYFVGAPDSGDPYDWMDFRGRVSVELSSTTDDPVICGELYDRVGIALAGLGDQNGDGWGDIAVGTDTNDEVYLFSNLDENPRDTEDATGMISAGTQSWSFGSSLAAPGDQDGDGIEDLLIGAPRNASAADDAGAVYLITDPIPGSISLAAADAILLGEAPGDGAGRAVASAGDMDLDGYDDLLIGASGADNGSGGNGAVYLVRGSLAGTTSLASSDAVFHSATTTGSIGWTITTAGDFDGDGVLDIALADPYLDDYSGGVYVHLGPLSGAWLTENAEFLIQREDDFASVGRAVISIGDNDGDGRSDLLVSDTRADDTFAGAVGIVRGRSWW